MRSPDIMRSVDDVVRQCQYVAGEAVGSSSLELGRSIRALASQIQTDWSPRDRFIVQHVLVKTIVRAAKTARAEHRLEVRNAIVSYVLSDAMAEPWSQNLGRFATSCATALEEGQAGSSPTADRDRVSAMLASIEERFTSPVISLATIAQASGLSRWHSARLLKASTGATFTEHVHRRRVEEAERLLVRTTLSIKEIAVQVGYANSGRLAHHFRRGHDTTPRAFRYRVVKSTARNDNE
jgi:AraC-like DNA-binding protein